MKLRALLIFCLLARLCVAQTNTATPAAPQYVLAAGISYDAYAQQSSNVNTLAIRIADIKGLPTYEQTTIETALVNWRVQPNTAATIRAGVCQTAYQTETKAISLGGCTDIGVTKAGDAYTVGTFSGSGWLAWDVGSKLTKGKAHIYIIPTYRMIAVNGQQIKPSYALRIGTGF